ELRVVEQVVDLPPQLQVTAAAAERDPFEERDVPVADTRQSDVVLVAAADAATRWAGVGARVEPMIERAVGTRQRWIAGQDGACAVPAAGEIRSGVLERERHS